jgi:hypothetical protein
MRKLLKSGLMASVMVAAGCAGDMGAEDERLGADQGTETPYWGCWGSISSSPWTTNTGFQAASGGGNSGNRTEAIAERGASHPYSVDLVTYSISGQTGSTQRRGNFYCAGAQHDFYYVSTWTSSVGTINPGCAVPNTLIKAQAQVRGAYCY